MNIIMKTTLNGLAIAALLLSAIGMNACSDPAGDCVVPDIAGVEQAFDISGEELQAAMGSEDDGPPDFAEVAATLGVTEAELRDAMGVPEGSELCAPDEISSETKTVTINGIAFDVSESYEFFTWAELPSDVNYERQAVVSFTNPAGDTHYYEAVYVSSGNLNWYQAARLAEDAGGYLASITSEEENSFVFDLVSDEKYFWHFSEEGEHYGISIGPFLGGYQPEGSEEPAGGWQWLSGETWSYTNWAVNLDDGIIDKDPRPNDQPNDSGTGQPIMGFGEMNVPVPTWGDYMADVGTYGIATTPGSCYGFIIEYESDPN